MFWINALIEWLILKLEWVHFLCTTWFVLSVQKQTDHSFCYFLKFWLKVRRLTIGLQLWQRNGWVDTQVWTLILCIHALSCGTYGLCLMDIYITAYRGIIANRKKNPQKKQPTTFACSMVFSSKYQKSLGACPFYLCSSALPHYLKIGHSYENFPNLIGCKAMKQVPLMYMENCFGVLRPKK